MFAEISRISQDIDLKTGVSSFFIVLTLPTGKVVRASVSPEDAQVLLVGSSEGSPQLDPPSEQPEPAYEPPPWARGEVPHISAPDVPEGAFVFGGQDIPAEDPPAPVVQVRQKPQRRMTTVPKDEMGYPIIRNGAIDPGEVVGHASGDADEEGIGQG